MPTDGRAAASHRWAAVWVTRAIAAQLSRLKPFEFLSLRREAETREVSHTGTWAHFTHKLERCVAAQTRQELGVANVEFPWRSSALGALNLAARTRKELGGGNVECPRRSSAIAALPESLRGLTSPSPREDVSHGATTAQSA